MLPLSATMPPNNTIHPMKQEAIDLARVHLANAQQQLLDAMRELIAAEALPDDQPVDTPAITGLRITENSGGGDAAITLGFGFDPVPGLQLEYRGDAGDPNGPQEWASIPVNAYANEQGTQANVNVWPSASRNLMVRATADGYGPALLIVTTSTEGMLNV